MARRTSAPTDTPRSEARPASRSKRSSSSSTCSRRSSTGGPYQAPNLRRSGLPYRAEVRRGGQAASLALVAAALLFGSTFLVVQDAVESADPLSFLVVRFTIGTLALLPLA